MEHRLLKDLFNIRVKISKKVLLKSLGFNEIQKQGNGNNEILEPLCESTDNKIFNGCFVQKFQTITIMWMNCKANNEYVVKLWTMTEKKKEKWRNKNFEIYLIMPLKDSYYINSE